MRNLSDESRYYRFLDTVRELSPPKAHEVFDGNGQDRATIGHMLDVLEKRTGKKGGSTVVVDRGMAYRQNLEEIRHRNYHYIVAGRQPERNE